MEMLRRQFGIAEPVRRGMELKIAAAGEWRPAALGGSSGVHKDILEGRDCEIGWEDVFAGELTTSLGALILALESYANYDVPRQRAPRSARLPHRDREQDEDELVEQGFEWEGKRRDFEKQEHCCISTWACTVRPF